MGKSYTYHIIGEGQADATGSARIYPCMNKREMAQAVYMADLLGLPMVAWSARTKTGTRWLNSGTEYVNVRPETVKLPKLVDCPVCGGRPGCIVCNWTGKTTRGYEKNWEPWQLRSIANT